MQPFSSHTGIAVPMIEDDINTDQMAPVQAMREMKPDYKKMLFVRQRAENPGFVLNKPQFSNPGTEVTGVNFGQITAASVNPRLLQFALRLVF